MTQQRVIRHDEGGLATLTLSRADQLNALDSPTFAELGEHLSDLAGQTDRIGCVVLRGAGRAFSAGADLKEVRGPGSDATLEPSVLAKLSALPQPTIAAIHGLCYTGGLELALACDFLIAGPEARFADTHGKWGFVATWGMGLRLPRRIGPAQAKRLMFTARPIDAAEARAIGLIDVLADDLERDLAEFTADLLANSWHTNFAMKRLLRETEHMPLAEALAHDARHNPGSAPDSKARLAAFAHKDR